MATGQPATGKAVSFAHELCLLLTPFRINTCKSASKQSTGTSRTARSSSAASRRPPCISPAFLRTGWPTSPSLMWTPPQPRPKISAPSSTCRPPILRTSGEFPSLPTRREPPSPFSRPPRAAPPPRSHLWPSLTCLPLGIRPSLSISAMARLLITPAISSAIMFNDYLAGSGASGTVICCLSSTEKSR
jgi:hypothetical protein